MQTLFERYSGAAYWFKCDRYLHVTQFVYREMALALRNTHNERKPISHYTIILNVRRKIRCKKQFCSFNMFNVIYVLHFP